LTVRRSTALTPLTCADFTPGTLPRRVDHVDRW